MDAPLEHIVRAELPDTYTPLRDVETIFREAHDAARILLEASFDPYDSREIELYCALEDAARANRRVLDIYEEI
jgi:hypothetical protein